mmetsp:Transcript_27705/g.64638  ORF Transcript_27705/g.64638 Transcript_27705/m.64638 type:complete len:216 (-) Transcript_27705:212-859(-)
MILRTMRRRDSSRPTGSKVRIRRLASLCTFRPSRRSRRCTGGGMSCTMAGTIALSESEACARRMSPAGRSWFIRCTRSPTLSSHGSNFASVVTPPASERSSLLRSAASRTSASVTRISPQSTRSVSMRVSRRLLRRLLCWWRRDGARAASQSVKMCRSSRQRVKAARSHATNQSAPKEIHEQLTHRYASAGCLQLLYPIRYTCLDAIQSCACAFA